MLIVMYIFNEGSTLAIIREFNMFSRGNVPFLFESAVTVYCRQQVTDKRCENKICLTEERIFIF